jgi:hypothetical protein
VSLAALDVLLPVTDVLIRVENEVSGTGHVVLPLSLTHVVLAAVGLVRVVRNVTLLLSTRHLVGCKEKKNKRKRLIRKERVILKIQL